MPDGQLLLGFVAASLVVLVIPGPGVIYVVARSVELGFRAGLASVAGLSVGAFVHVVAATLGISAILASSATAFTAVKLLGAGYLIYLGVRTPTAKSERALNNPGPRLLTTRLFWDGIVISAFNPKIAVFFLAYLPQFVDPDKGGATYQILLLGTLYVCLAVLSDGTYAFVSSRARTQFAKRIVKGSISRYCTGGIFVGLGINTALSGKSS